MSDMTIFKLIIKLVNELRSSGDLEILSFQIKYEDFTDSYGRIEK